MLSQLATVLSIGPGADIRSEMQSQIFCPLFRSMDFRCLQAEPAADGKETRRVASAHVGRNVNGLFIPSHAPGIPLWSHPTAIQLSDGRFRLASRETGSRL